MFTSTHEKELERIKDELYLMKLGKLNYQKKFNSLRREWNSLVDRVNKLGGEQLFEQSSQSTQFTDQELKRLIQLCHPDKHKNSQLAVEMTQKLNKMRK
jgi:ABC-type multidrug transport system ATPase subunit